VLNLIGLLDPSERERVERDWGERPPRPDVAELVAFREKVLGRQEYNPFEED